MTSPIPGGLLIGAATSAHQVEGGNCRNDVWAAERAPGSPFLEPSGQAADSWNRWEEDVRLAAALGLDAYRFSLEWSRVEPSPGKLDKKAVGHYQRMVQACRDAGVQPVVTLHHFTSPLWLAQQGGWTDPRAAGCFARFVEMVLPVLDQVDLVLTINEPTILVEWSHRLTVPPQAGPDARVRDTVLAAHREAVDILHGDRAGRQVGLTLALHDWEVLPGGEQLAAQLQDEEEDWWLRSLAGDDVVGVQTYTCKTVGPHGVVPPGADEPTTLTGWRVRPRAVAATARRAAAVSGLPVVVTENGIATDDDDLRWDYVRQALAAVSELLTDGVDVRGWFYWSLLDNFEWLQGYAPTFGLIEVDRRTLERRVRPSGLRLAELLRTRS